jgi:hypothetical protein
MAVWGVVLDALQEESCMDHLVKEGGLQVTGGSELQPAHQPVTDSTIKGPLLYTTPATPSWDMDHRPVAGG